jgi:dihydroorotate dehydrogenase
MFRWSARLVIWKKMDRRDRVAPPMAAFFDLAARLLRLLPAEMAHRLTIRTLAAAPAGWLAYGAGGAWEEDHVLATRVFGLDFPNPIGLAAGFDKNAEAFRHMQVLGFGFAEIGSITPRPQRGNPRPRLFRLPADQAIVNRMGFNNDGLATVQRRLRGRDPQIDGILGANLGKNKDSDDAVADYVAGVRALAPMADYLVVNVSSPNTPDLRALQGREPLAALLGAVRVARGGPHPPLLLKIAPDLTEDDKADIAEVALAGGADGLIVSNTTIARPAGLAGPAAKEAGGLSGRPLFAPSTAVLADMYRLTGGRLPLIGVGGIASAEDAYAKIRAGASLLQLYTALVYQGPGLIARIKYGLAQRLRADGFASLAEAVGADHANRGARIS